MSSITRFLKKNQQPILGILILLCVVGMFRMMATSVAQSANRQVDIDIPKHLPIKVKFKKEKEQAIKSMGNEKWLRDFELEVENTGTKPIYFLHLMVILPETRTESGDQVMFPLYYGPEIGNIRTKPDPTDVPNKPGIICV